MYSQKKYFIYQLISSFTDKNYVGHTISTIRKRFNSHKNDYKKYLKGSQNYISSFEIIKYNDFKIDILEEGICNSRNELLERETSWIEYYGDKCVNIKKYVNNKKENRKHKIYKLLSSHTDKIYVGYTIRSLNTRLWAHRVDYRKYLKSELDYISSIEIFKLSLTIEDVEIELLEEFEDENLIKIKEQYWMDKYKDIIVNKNKCYLTNEERKENARIISGRWKNNNLEKARNQRNISARKNNYKLREKIICECGSKIAKGCLFAHKRSKKHIDYLNSLKNDNDIKIKQDDVKYTCECGMIIHKYCKYKHFRTQIHINYLNSITNDDSKKLKYRQEEKIECECGIFVNKGGMLRHTKSKKHINYINNLNNS